jgi:hypothetical protein
VPRGTVIENGPEEQMLSNGNSFELGGGNTYNMVPGEGTGDGTRPASSSWLFAVNVWRLR